MATAKPSMSASVGVVDDRSTKPVAAVITPTPIAMPNKAVKRGRPAATKEPNVMTRTTAATATPITSVRPLSDWISNASPPTSTVRPSSRAWSTAAFSASRASSVSSAAGTW